jgi:hypothetical protein
VLGSHGSLWTSCDFLNSWISYKPSNWIAASWLRSHPALVVTRFLQLRIGWCMLDPDRSIPTTVILPELEVGAIETLEDHWVSLVAPGQKQRTLVIPWPYTRINHSGVVTRSSKKHLQCGNWFGYWASCKCSQQLISTIQKLIWLLGQFWGRFNAISELFQWTGFAF